MYRSTIVKLIYMQLDYTLYFFNSDSLIDI